MAREQVDGVVKRRPILMLEQALEPCCTNRLWLRHGSGVKWWLYTWLRGLARSRRFLRSLVQIPLM